jgi:hypothetical protein
MRLWTVIRNMLPDHLEELVLGAVAGLVFGLFGWFAGGLMFGLGYFVTFGGGNVLFGLRSGIHLGRYELAYAIVAVAPLAALLLVFGLTNAVVR